MPYYENSIIYKLKRNDDHDDVNIYIGSTTNFKTRKYQHKECCNDIKLKGYNIKIYQFIRDNGGYIYVCIYIYRGKKIGMPA